MDKTCLSCGQPLELLGRRQFRVGGTTGGWKLLFGEWAELGEELVDFEVWACPGCRKVEFYLPEK
ncbi:MAG: hypothetical protein PWQ86_177 [Bacillota bacterium]|nr:hypothetical protein [Bacillota bacterium]